MHVQTLALAVLLGVPAWFPEPARAADAIFGEILPNRSAPEYAGAGPATEAQSRDAEARALRRRNWERTRMTGVALPGASPQSPAVAVR